MVRGIGVVLLVLLAGNAWADGLQVNLKSVAVAQVVQLVAGEYLGADYVLGPGAVAAGERVTVSVKSLDREAALPFLRAVLAGVGLEVREQGGVLFVDKMSSAPPGGKQDILSTVNGSGGALSRSGPFGGGLVRVSAPADAPGRLAAGYVLADGLVYVLGADGEVGMAEAVEVGPWGRAFQVGGDRVPLRAHDPRSLPAKPEASGELLTVSEQGRGSAAAQGDPALAGEGQLPPARAQAAAGGGGPPGPTPPAPAQAGAVASGSFAIPSFRLSW